MNSAFEHIEQVRYLSARIFESGLNSCGNLNSEIKKLSEQAEELSLDTGADLLKKLAAALSALRAGQGGIKQAAVIYSNLVSYYGLVSELLILEKAF